MRGLRAPALSLLLLAGAVEAADEPVRHSLAVRLDPATGHLRVTDTLVLPERIAGQGRPFEIALNAALEIRDSAPALEAAGPTEPAQGLVLGGRPAGRDSAASVRRYTVPALGTDRRLTLTYEGRFDFGLSDPAEEYTRGFRDTVGVVSPEGVYLAAAGFWYPVLDDGLTVYDLEVEQPEGWHVVSAGRGTSRGDDGRARWTAELPADEIYLVGGPLRVWRGEAGAVETLVYLRDTDDALAAKYLGATAQYLTMYRGLIGEYPYAKFALVENFWETGYGMPSFTLLGPQVIRFPFILTSSYPHEILHNWWGNGVFVDYATGNWCEGLTAYLADHLIQEQQGRGEAYRRDTLQKYRNYVRDARDFPLAEFRARHSAATEAVGYGKSLMGFHMLRRKLGDESFAAALSRFYREQRGRQASFRDLESGFEAATGQELGPFFDAWIERAGAPSLVVEAVAVERDGASRAVRGVLRQIQEAPPFPVDVPLAIDTVAGRESVSVTMAERTAPFRFAVSGEPVLLRVDPQFDVFRLLDPREMPPSIGQIFGDPRILAVLPAGEGPDAVKRYRDLAESWISESHAIEFASDDGLSELPPDRSVWILGRRNALAERLFGAGAVRGLEVGQSAVRLGGEEMPVEGRSLVVVRRHPASLEHAVGWIVADPEAAIPGLGRKLPHYGKYSYLGFAGEAPDNVIKGQWPAADSPLAVDLRPEGERDRAPEVAPFEQRRALAELPPVFSETALAEHVRWLAAPEREGRGVGTRGLEQAAAWVAEKFAAIGLAPGGDDGGYLQWLEVPQGPSGAPQRVANVIGYLPGARADRAGQSVVVAAHVDHLGLGWPDVHQGDEGRLHPGADDNASGVAVLLELAASFAAGDPPARDLVFAAFTAEEAGRLGSRWFVEHPGRFALAGMRGVINLDTVGRLGAGPVSVLATGTADEWQHVFRGVGFVTGIEPKLVPESLDSSDQMTFIERGVPAVQIFTGAHADYHRPGDTVERVDTAGLVKVATFVREAVAYLVEREPPLSVTIAGAGSGTRPGGASAGRRVAFGTVPEFGFAGPGVQVASVVAGSPAERAGIRAGDVLIRLDDREIADLRAFSELLRASEPGQTVRATLLRAGAELTVPVTLEAR